MSINTDTLELPKEVANVLGDETAAIFEKWLDEKIATRLEPHAEISATTARRKVGLFLLEHVAGQLLACDPELVRKDSGVWVWRVPIDLAYVRYGSVGRVGSLDVDTQSGMIDYTSEYLEELKANAIELARIALKDEPDPDPAI